MHTITKQTHKKIYLQIKKKRLQTKKLRQKLAANRHANNWDEKSAMYAYPYNTDYYHGSSPQTNLSTTTTSKQEVVDMISYEL